MGLIRKFLQITFKIPPGPIQPAKSTDSTAYEYETIECRSLFTNKVGDSSNRSTLSILLLYYQRNITRISIYYISIR